jgi:hypothetical protein
MRQSSRKQEDRNSLDEPLDSGLWAWLKKKENRVVLSFIGAAIVAAVGLLVKMGFFEKQPENNLSASGNGVVVITSGNHNKVNVDPPHQ